MVAHDVLKIHNRISTLQAGGVYMAFHPPLYHCRFKFFTIFYFSSSPSLKDNAQPILKATEILYK
jgi:hypothetical protein